MRHRGFTLIELLISVGVVGVLMSAVGGVIVLSVRAIPSNQAATQGAVEATAALSRMAGELRMATSVIEGTATAVEFVVPDRTGDDRDDTIRYEWDGTAGGSIARTLNGGTPMVVASGVASLDLSYRVSSTSHMESGAWSVGAESLMVSYDNALPSEHTLTSGRGIGMSVTPAMNTDAICYSVSKVAVRLRKGGTVDGRVRVQVRLADNAGLPTSTVLAEGTVDESSLSASMNFVNVTMSGADGLSPGTRVCVVVMHDAGIEAARTATFTAAPLGTDLAVSTSNSGATWTSTIATSVCVRVYCTVTTTTLTNVPSNSVERVNIHLRSTLAGAPEAQAFVALANAPGVE